MLRMSGAAILMLASLAMFAAGCESSESGHDAHEGHEMSPESGGHDDGMKMEEGSTAAKTPTLESSSPSADYPLKTCVVSGEPLDAMDGPVAYMYGDVEVQFCCNGCVDKFKKDPEKYLAELRSAAK